MSFEMVCAKKLFCLRHAAALCMLYKVNTNLNHCLFSGLPSSSVKVRHIRTAAAAHPLEVEVSGCRTSQFERCFLPAQTRVWNDLPYTVRHWNVRWVQESSQS